MRNKFEAQKKFQAQKNKGPAWVWVIVVKFNARLVDVERATVVIEEPPRTPLPSNFVGVQVVPLILGLFLLKIKNLTEPLWLLPVLRSVSTGWLEGRKHGKATIF